MSDPLRTDAAQGSDRAVQIDRGARIEQLLLAGLDHYFAADYEQAINIWTRVVFLERGHSRARAYIERARGALAERQRESEEVLHRGMDAFNRGDTDTARTLINQVVEDIGPNDVAMVFLDRLNRLGSSRPVDQGQRAMTVDAARPRRPGALPIPPRRRRSWLLAGTILLAAAATLALAGLGLYSWFADSPGLRLDAARVVRDEPLPIVRPPEMAVGRARILYGGGHLRDALSALDAVGLADPLRVEADALRAEIQRRLLEAAHASQAGPGAVPADSR